MSIYTDVDAQIALEASAATLTNRKLCRGGCVDTRMLLLLQHYAMDPHRMSRPAKLPSRPHRFQRTHWLSPRAGNAGRDGGPDA